MTYIIIYTHGIKLKPVLAAVIVQYFFTVAGYLLAEDRSSDVAAYVVKRIKRLYPQYCISFLLIFFVSNALEGNTLSGYLRNLFFSLDELFMVQEWFFSSTRVIPVYNGVTWYVSVMLLAQIFLFWCLKRYREFTECVICPIAVAVLYSYAYRTAGTITMNQLITGIYCNWSLLRAFMGLSIGIIGNRVVKEIQSRRQNKTVNKTGIRLLKHMGVHCLFIFLFVLASYPEEILGGDAVGLSGFVLSLLLGVIVPIGFADNYNIPFIKKIGKYTYSIYLIQLLFIQRVDLRLCLRNDTIWVRTLVLFALCTVTGILIELISSLLFSIRNRIHPRRL